MVNVIFAVRMRHSNPRFKSVCTGVLLFVAIVFSVHGHVAGKNSSAGFNGGKPVRGNIPILPTDNSLKQKTRPGKPLLFIENKGQITDQDRKPRQDIQYAVSAGSGLNIFIGRGAIHYQFVRQADATEPQPSNRVAVKEGKHNAFDMYRMDVELIDANQHAHVIAEESQPYYENYFTEATGKQGATAHSCSRVVYKDIYPKIDWILYTLNGKLKYEFKVHEGGRVADIKIKYGGATTLALNQDGGLTATTPQGVITENAPISYGQDGKAVMSSFRLSGDIVRYEMGNYSGELTIDPYVEWATYYGGTEWDVAHSLVTDEENSVYMGGSTTSPSGIATSGAYTEGHAIHTTVDAFLVKFNSAGEREWGTYYGFYGESQFLSLVYKGYYVYAAGYVETDNEFEYYHFCYVKFTSGGYPVAEDNSNHVGDGDRCESIAIDNAGNFYLAGYTKGTTGLATAGSHQPVYGGGAYDAFLMKYNSSGVRQWVTYFGGEGVDKAHAVSVDPSGNIFISGRTNSTTGIASSGAFMTGIGGSNDAFLAKFNSSGVRLWSTYFGGPDDDQSMSMAVDDSGYAYITGKTVSTEGIATAGAYQTTNGGGSDLFIAKFSAGGSRQWATYYGGAATEETILFIGDGSSTTNSIITDHSGNVYMCGASTSSGLATSDASQVTNSGSSDCILVKFSKSGSRLWATYYGGPSIEYPSALTLDATGALYMAGYARSSTAISTPDAHQYVFGGYYDGFLAKFRNGNAPITGPRRVCVGSTITLTADSTGGYWSSGDASLATVGSSSGIVTGVSGGVVFISYTHISGNISTYAIGVDITDGGVISGPSTVCAGIESDFFETATGGAWSSGNDAIASIDDYSGAVQGHSAGIVTLSYTIANGCGTYYATKIITVNPAPNAGTISGSNFVCIAGTITLSPSVTGGTWESVLPTIASVNSAGVVTGLSGGTGIIRYSVTNDCGTAMATKTVTVNPLPNAGTITGTFTSCPAAATTLSDGVSGGVWTSSNASVATIGSTGILSAVSVGTAQISYTVTNGCGSSSAVITVTVAGASAGVITGAGSLCAGATATMTNTVTGGTWSSSNAAIATIGTAGDVTAIGPGVTAISYSVSGSCGAAVATKMLSVNALASAGAVTGSSTVCVGATITLSDVVTGGTWSSGSTSVATVGTSGIVTGAGAGVASISYFVTNGCGTVSAIKDVTVNPLPDAVP